MYYIKVVVTNPPLAYPVYQEVSDDGVLLRLVDSQYNEVQATEYHVDPAGDSNGLLLPR